VILAQLAKIGARILTADGANLTSTDDPTRCLIRQLLALELAGECRER